MSEPPHTADTSMHLPGADDPRVGRLAEARWRLRDWTPEEWHTPGAHNPEARRAEALEWLRAAVVAGLLPAAELRSPKTGVCGFLHDQWDGPYKTSRRCIADAGHTDGVLAHDHGPWMGVK